jgi:hypothetical protein
MRSLVSTAAPERSATVDFPLAAAPADDGEASQPHAPAELERPADVGGAVGLVAGHLAGAHPRDLRANQPPLGGEEGDQGFVAGSPWASR